jgi:hypothetical protein
MAMEQRWGEASEVNHRTRRQPPTFPARRGMRSAWFRGRSSADDDVAANHAAPHAADAPHPADAASARSSTEAAAEGDTTSMPPMRPVHGHPTF